MRRILNSAPIVASAWLTMPLTHWRWLPFVGTATGQNTDIQYLMHSHTRWSYQQVNGVSWPTAITGGTLLCTMVT